MEQSQNYICMFWHSKAKLLWECFRGGMGKDKKHSTPLFIKTSMFEVYVQLQIKIELLWFLWSINFIWKTTFYTRNISVRDFDKFSSVLWRKLGEIPSILMSKGSWSGSTNSTALRAFTLQSFIAQDIGSLTKFFIFYFVESWV